MTPDEVTRIVANMDRRAQYFLDWWDGLTPEQKKAVNAEFVHQVTTDQIPANAARLGSIGAYFLGLREAEKIKEYRK
jgi:hypothetical protein